MILKKPDNPKHIYLIAGEASGDFIGAQLMKSIKVQDPDTIFSGVGGPLMIAQGLESLFPMHDLSVMGISEVLPRLNLILKRIKQATDNILVIKPDILVTIDAPDFCHRVIKKVKNKSNDPPKCIHYVAPTVWAWRPKRAKKIAQFLDGLLCLFDFEPPYFEKHGLNSIAVGHPMMETGFNIAKKASIGDNDKQKIGVFFGSRQGEIKRISPTLLGVMEKIQLEKGANVEFIIPTLKHLKEPITHLVKNIKSTTHVIVPNDDKWSIFKACDVALAVSGTVGLELAVANVPHIIGYKMNPVTHMIAKQLIKTPYAHLANIMMGHEIVPEFIQDDCNAVDMTAELLTLLEDLSYQRNQTDEFIKLRERMGALNAPSKNAADYLLRL
jgi:lipid-A-disaccharide synthase